jgi:hypothetical protein
VTPREEILVRRWFRVLPSALLTLTACAPVLPPGGVTTDTNDFRVEAHSDSRKGRPVAVGYVYNKRGLQATHVQLRVETLDAAGAVVASDVRFLDRDVNPNDRVYFEVPPSAGGTTYRVSVQYVSWQPGGGGAGSGGM